MKENRTKKISVVLGTLSLVILVGSQYLNEVLNLYVGNNRGFFTPIIAVVAIMFLASLFIMRSIKKNRYSTILIVILLIAYLLTLILQPGKSTLNIIDFFGMCILPIAVGAYLRIDYKLAFRGCMVLLLLAVPVFGKLFLKANIGLNYDAVSMSTSYDILPISIAGSVYIIYFGKDSKLFDKLLFILSIVFVFSLIRMSYRGALLSLAISLLTAFYFRKPSETYKRRLQIIALGLLLILVIANIEYILEIMSGILQRINVRVAFIDKTLYLLKTDTIGHGRLEIWLLAFRGFLSSPLWGNGMATFQYYTGYPFPHNYLLEFLFDGGVLLFVPLAIIFGYAIKKLIGSAWTGDRYQFAFTMMTGSISLVRGFFSAESWRIILLWLFIGLALNNNETDYMINEQQ